MLPGSTFALQDVYWLFSISNHCKHLVYGGNRWRAPPPSNFTSNYISISKTYLLLCSWYMMEKCGLVMMEKCEWRFASLLMCCRWVSIRPHVHVDTLWYSNPRKFPIIQETNSCQYMSISWEKDVWCEISKALFGESVKLSTSLFISRCFEVYELWQSYVICIYPRMWSSHWHHGIIEQYYDEEILILKGRGW
jgi:hypothetical protein